MKNLKAFIKKHDTAVFRTLILILLSPVLTYLTETTVRASFANSLSWISRYPEAFIVTSILIFFIMFALFTIIRRIDFPFLITSAIFFALGAASYFKNSYRSEPIYPWDLGIISEAADISSEMQLIPTLPMIISLIIILAIFVTLLVLHIIFVKKKIIRFHKKTKKRKIQLAVQPIVSIIVLLTFFFGVIRNSAIMSFFGISESAFRQAAAANRNGISLSFAMNTKYIFPDKPSDYSKETMDKIVGEIQSEKTEEKIKPNIIYIMSESYADISLCKNVTFHDDIFHSTNALKEHFVSGTLLGAQFGGGTCNSEFEVLTGFSMANLPAGCTPYQQYFNSEMISYPKYLKELGYNTVAIHSYGKQFWNRDVAYPNMGFDKFISEEDFVDPLRRRGLIKDDELVSMVIKEYEENLKTGKPFFNFSVTMQNHGSFTNGQYLENYRASLSCDELNEEQEGILITYATGIRDANIALDKLISYFQEVKEPTIICMFGDHLGSLGGNDDIYVKSGLFDGYPEENATNLAQKYTTPFFIWDNFTTLNFESPRMSFYQLIPSVCSWYDLDMPLYFNYLLEQKEIFRGTAMELYVNGDGSVTFDSTAEIDKYIQKHNLFQYDLMFGKKYSLESVYSYK